MATTDRVEGALCRGLPLTQADIFMLFQPCNLFAYKAVKAIHKTNHVIHVLYKHYNI